MTTSKKVMILSFIFITLLIIGCKNSDTPAEDSSGANQATTLEEAEKTAERFARFWEQKDFSSMHDLFVPSLKNKRDKEDFAKFFLASEKESNIVIRLDKVSLDKENVAYAYYTVSSSIYDTKAPAMKLEYIEGKWSVNAFPSFFTSICAEECANLTCTEAICSKETDYQCRYKEIESCKQNLCTYDWDCNLSISREIINDCESQGFKFYIRQYCSDNVCNFTCSESVSGPRFTNPTMEESAKLKLKVSWFDDPINIKNNDVPLTKVTILINEIYKKEMETIPQETNLNINRSEFISNDGSKLKRSQEISDIYIHTQQGKWWKS